jgi:hypothetical protein
MVRRYQKARNKVLSCNNEELVDVRADFRALHNLLADIIDATNAALEHEVTPPANTDPSFIPVPRERKIRSGG